MFPIPGSISPFAAEVDGKQVHMQEQRERWMELAELAAKEQDSGKLLDLVHEINELLGEKQQKHSPLLSSVTNTPAPKSSAAK